MGTPFASPLPLLAVLAAALAALAVLLLRERRRDLREGASIAAAALTLGIVVAMLPRVVEGGTPEARLFTLSPGIELVLRADAAGMVFALLASFLWVLAAFYSIGYMRGGHEDRQTRFYAAFALSVAATVGVAFAGNLLTFVLFYELLTLFTYPLVVHRQTPEAVAAGRKYLAYTLSGGLALIAGAAWLEILRVDGTFVAGGILDALRGEDATLWGLFALLTFGVAVKAAVMPFHSWLPSAMVAPTPVSALLHAVAVVKAGVFGVVRVVGFVFGPALLEEMGAWNVLAVAAAATVLIASLLALRHDNLKRRLAYSTISHLSYIVLGLALLGPMALTGALLHMVGHGVTKITLFFCAGAIHVRTHKENVSELVGIGRQMPFTMTAFTLASLSMVGLPPFVLFTSKWFLGRGAVLAGNPTFMFVYVVSGLLAAGYLFPICIRAFLRRSAAFPRFGEASPFMVAPLFITGVLALWLGIAPDLPFRFFDLATAVAAAVTGTTAIAGGVP
ncbi:MAG: monovalent cation/H+ antiporter subunit D family protein [SAR202 cluster bacterium]|nr:monovalent cation/H+ antiporter subunit D family protein [SAR202 cluster bacterium]